MHSSIELLLISLIHNFLSGCNCLFNSQNCWRVMSITLGIEYYWFSLSVSQSVSLVLLFVPSLEIVIVQEKSLRGTNYRFPLYSLVKKESYKMVKKGIEAWKEPLFSVFSVFSLRYDTIRYSYDTILLRYDTYDTYRKYRSIVITIFFLRYTIRYDTVYRRISYRIVS